MSAPTKPQRVVQVSADGARADATRLLAEETPVALSYNGASHVVMMATPADLTDFGLGFALSEGIIAHRDELRDLHCAETGYGIEIAAAIPMRRAAVLRDRRRAMTGRTGCGLCGVETLEQALRPLPLLPPASDIADAAIFRALAALPDWQVLNRATGAVHAAVWADADGRILLAREDVGRHNALDKLIGAMAWADMPPANGFALISSRCSTEMVQKSVAAGITTLAAISAPTALACRIAAEHGLRLVALARPDSLLRIG